MSTSATLLANKILKDRLIFLVKLLKAQPLYKIPNRFKERYKIHLPEKEIKKAYDYWENRSHYSEEYHAKQFQTKEEFSELRSKILKRINEDIADFMYHHWKQYKSV